MQLPEMRYSKLVQLVQIRRLPRETVVCELQYMQAHKLLYILFARFYLSSSSDGKVLA